MTRKILMITALSFLFAGCASTNNSISPDKTTYEKVETSTFNGGAISSEFLMTSEKNKTGTLRKYGYDGKVTSNTDIVNGVKSGFETLYDKEGRVLKKTPYTDGYIQGNEYIYYQGGKVMVKTPYLSGKKHGKAIAYNVDGSVNKTATYKKGRRIR